MILAKEIDGELWVKASDHHRLIKDAQRTWVEMSDARIKGIFSYHGQFASGKDLPMLRVIEAMLKENASPQRTWVGLTDEEIEDIWADCPVDWDDKINILTFARAIEAAHGIKGAE